jgi:hypothetical protein
MTFSVKPTFLGKVLQLEIWGATGPATVYWNDPLEPPDTVVAAPGGVVSHDYGSEAGGSAFVTVTVGAEVADIDMWLNDFAVMDRPQVTRWIEGSGAESPLDPAWWVLPVEMDEMGFLYLCYGHPISFMSFVNTKRGVMMSIPPNTFDDIVVGS